ncbi:15802_t:CDS:2 [Entrophospora sp. SA101]|nr:10068_t:CDS:2 [Entrophospora sp. SA101]CAJ0753475.1 15802_t:CDS:2 [Entrophospora sp. SA101]CAJ0904504.1 8915_t:CDS:2 [Entrophospora sp. SA101]
MVYKLTDRCNHYPINIVSSNHLLINNPVHPIIKLPFPPKIDPLDLIPVKPSSPQATQSNFKPTRSPNAFIIYRKAFVKAAREEGQCLPMTVISSMASSSWEQEPDEVKAEYKRIAKAAYLKRKEFPQIDSNSNFISNPYGSNSYDPLLLTPEFSEPSNFENINFNNFNQPEIFNLSDWFGYDGQIQKQTADNGINNEIYKNIYYGYNNNNLYF